MKLVEVNWSPTNRQLRQFAVICVVALPIVGWIWGGNWSVVGLLAATGLLIALAGVVMPQAVKPIFLALMIVAAPIGIVIGEASMLLIYFGVFLPMALIFRVVGRDALQINVDREATTYWQAKRRPTSASSYFRQS
jgi:hypothetical protein